MSKADVEFDWVTVTREIKRTYRQVRNAFGLATPIGHVVPPRGTFRRAYAEFLVALRRAFDR